MLFEKGFKMWLYAEIFVMLQRSLLGLWKEPLPVFGKGLKDVALCWNLFLASETPVGSLKITLSVFGKGFKDVVLFGDLFLTSEAPLGSRHGFSKNINHIFWNPYSFFNYKGLTKESYLCFEKGFKSVALFREPFLASETPFRSRLFLSAATARSLKCTSLYRHSWCDRVTTFVACVN